MSLMYTCTGVSNLGFLVTFTCFSGCSSLWQGVCEYEKEERNGRKEESKHRSNSQVLLVQHFPLLQFDLVLFIVLILHKLTQPSPSKTPTNHLTYLLLVRQMIVLLKESLQYFRVGHVRVALLESLPMLVHIHEGWSYWFLGSFM